MARKLEHISVIPLRGEGAGVCIHQLPSVTGRAAGGRSFTPFTTGLFSAIPGHPEKALSQRTAGVVDGKAVMHGNGESQGDIGGRGTDTNSTCYQSYTKN